MKYLDTIKEAHDLVCKARNLVDELGTDLAQDTDVNSEIDLLVSDLVDQIQTAEDTLFSGCNIDDINEWEAE